MGRTVLAEEGLLQCFLSFSKTQPFSFGLILGQHSIQKDFVVHVAPTSIPEDAKKSGKPVKGVQDIQEIWLTEHARQVTLLMPGGLCVLGIFVAGPSEPFHGGKVPQLLQALYKAVCKNAFVFGSGGCHEKLVAYVNPHKESVTCKTLDMESHSSSFRPADWKFQSNPAKWQQLKCSFHIDMILPLIAEAWKDPLKNHVQISLTKLKHVLDRAKFIIDGAFRSEFEVLISEDDKGGKKKVAASPKVHSINILLEEVPHETGESGDSEPDWQVFSEGARLVYEGAMYVLAYVNHKATVQEAMDAVKQDILRSLSARLEMHCDSLLDDEQRANMADSRILHEPPRRVLVPLPASPILVADYLFPGEGPQEALPSMVELLGIQLSPGEVVDDIEVHGEHDEAKTGSEAEMLVDTLTETQLLPSRDKSCNVSGVLLAILIVIAGVALSYITLQGTSAH